MSRVVSELPPVVGAVRAFVTDEVRPVAAELEHADRYPHALVARMRDLGLFGALVPAAYGGLGLDVTTYARVIEELCRGFMSLAGVINSHTMAALIVLHHGTEEQRRRLLPRFASGDARGGLCLTEPHAGSDVQAIRTRARRAGDVYIVAGTKMFVTNGREGNAFALLAVTDPTAQPRHRGMSCFIVEKGHPGLRVAQSIGKLGYKAVDTAELVFDDFEVPVANLVGGVEGRGFGQVMSGLETGRINIAARAVGVAQAAFDSARAAAAAAATSPPALADMAARLGAARGLTYWAAGMKDRQERCDLEAGIAKLAASETAQALTLEALRVGGERAALLSSDVERLYRDTPLMIVGEGTNEIQRTIIARQLLQRYGERLGALTSPEGEADERRQMVLAVRQFVEKAVVPVAAEHDRAGRHPDDLVAQLGDLGVLGAVVPPALGGLGLDAATAAMLVEELARGSATLAGVVGAHVAATAALAGFGAAAEREASLPRLARGALLGTVAGGGAVTIRGEGPDRIVDGATGLADNAARAQVFVVLAAGAGGGDAAVALPRDAAGLAVGPAEPGLGGRGLETAALVLGGVRVPRGAVLGAADGREAAAAAAAGGWLRLMLAAIAVGVSQAAFEAALRYSQQRSAFGRPICQHQAVQLALADMATAVTAARRLTSAAADALAAGDDTPAGLARLHAAETACRVTLDALRVHGGYGYTNDFPVERYYRDAPRLLLALGGPDAERARLARRLVAEG